MAKNIVLLSDGTGNSAAKPFKTNVWRFYQAVDINPPKTDNEPKQVVLYDDGVGTENFKPLAYLGLALGVGLARNIKDLYTFLCRNYQEGDNIFLLGFSRGAFTVRVLSGLILRCGLVTADNESELKERVQHVYDEYKLDVARRATATGRAMVLGWLFGGSKKAYRRDTIKFNFTQVFPQIAFIGVWDTVDAYGMPIDEIKQGIDRYIWPMTLADRNLSSHVIRACQALSLDDERPTFRPVLWNEKTLNEVQLTQIWFSGVHANVGGGYPDDGLAYVTMQWMMDEAQKQGLWFYPQARIDVDSRANAQGKQYDSRSGLAGYYRYGPRNVDYLCRDKDHGVYVTRPKVHVSAIQRIAYREVAYAPMSFPTDYVVLARQTGMQPTMGTIKRPETDDEIEQRKIDIEMAWDVVARRRVAYSSTVILTALLVVLPLRPAIAKGFEWLVGKSALISSSIADALLVFGALIGWPLRLASSIAGYLWSLMQAIPGVDGVLQTLACVAIVLLGLLKSFLWSWADIWPKWYEGHPIFFLIVVLLLAWLFVSKSGRLQSEVFERADHAWRNLRGNTPPPALPLGSSPPPSPRMLKRRWADMVIRRVRKTAAVQVVYRFITKRIVPLLFALLALLVGLLILPFFIPKFYRQLVRRRRYRAPPGPTEPTPTPTPRIPPSPFQSQPDVLAKELSTKKLSDFNTEEAVKTWD